MFHCFHINSWGENEDFYLFFTNSSLPSPTHRTSNDRLLLFASMWNSIHQIMPIFCIHLWIYRNQRTNIKHKKVLFRLKNTKNPLCVFIRLELIGSTLRARFLNLYKEYRNFPKSILSEFAWSDGLLTTTNILYLISQFHNLSSSSNNKIVHISILFFFGLHMVTQGSTLCIHVKICFALMYDTEKDSCMEFKTYVQFSR